MAPSSHRAVMAVAAMTRTPTDDAKHNRLPKPSKAGLDSRCMTGRALCISKSSRTAVWMVDGKIRQAMDVRFGSAYTPTREGRFKVNFKSRHHHSTLYDTPMPYAMFFSRGQAVHYSADFAARGAAGLATVGRSSRNWVRLSRTYASADALDAWNRVEVMGIFAHELGHVLGFQHTATRCSLMSPVLDVAGCGMFAPADPGWYRCRTLDTSLVSRLVRTYGAEVVEAACARALELDVVDVTKIGRMLEQARERERPAEPAKVVGGPARFARDAAEFTTVFTTRPSR